MELNEYDALLDEQQDNKLNEASEDTDYDTIIDDLNVVEANNVKQIVDSSKKNDPSSMVEPFNLSKKHNLPIESVHRNIDKIKSRDENGKTDFSTLVKVNPALSSWLKKPANTAVGYKELKPLQEVEQKALRIQPNKNQERFTKQLDKAGASGWHQLTASSNVLLAAYGKLDLRDVAENISNAHKKMGEIDKTKPDYVKEFEQVTQKEIQEVDTATSNRRRSMKRIEEARKRLNKQKEITPNDREEFNKLMDDYHNGIIENLGEYIDLAWASISRPKGLIYSAMQSAVSSAPALIGGATGGFFGGPLGVAAGSFAGGVPVEIGASVLEDLGEKIDLTDSEAVYKALSDEKVMKDILGRAQRKGVTTAGVDALFAMVAGKALAKAGSPVKGAAKGGGIKSLIKGSNIKASAKGLAQDLAQETAGETIGEYAGQVAREKGDLSKVSMGQSIFEGLVSVGSSTSTVITGAMVRTRDALSQDPIKAAQEALVDVQNAKESITEAQALEELGTALEQAENTTQADGAIAELIELTESEDGEASAIFMQPDDWNNYWEGKGENPVAKAYELGDEVGKSYSEATALDTDMQIPVSSYAQKLGGTEDFKGLIPSAKLRSDAMTLNQANESVQNFSGVMSQLVKENVEYNGKFKESAVEVKARIKDQLKLAGFSDKDAEVQASLYEGRITNRAMLRGEDPLEIFRNQGLTIRRKGQQVIRDNTTYDMILENKKKQDKLNKKEEIQEIDPSKLQGEALSLAEDMISDEIAQIAYEIRQSEESRSLLLKDKDERVVERVVDKSTFPSYYAGLKARNRAAIEKAAETKKGALYKRMKLLAVERLKNGYENNHSGQVIPDNEFRALINLPEFGNDTISDFDLFQSIDKTKTPEFKKWFGDSKVVDENGDPIVVHHGGLGSQSITEFSKDFGGQTTGNNEHGAFHFTDNKEVADDYGRQSFIRRYQDSPESLVEDGIVEELPDFDEVDQYGFVEELAEEHLESVDTYLRLENPIILDMEGQRIDVQQIEDISRAAMTGEYIEGVSDLFEDQLYGEYDSDDIADYQDDINKRAMENEDVETIEELEDYQLNQARDEILEENGIERDVPKIDGIIIKNMIDDIGPASNQIAEQYIVFDPNQIKSVKNKGEFSTENDNIFFQQDQKVKNAQAIREVNKDSLGFYSKLESEVSEMDFKNIPAKNLANRIKKLDGVKQGELEHTGIIEYLTTFEGKISKEEVISYLQNNGLQVKEVILNDKYEIQERDTGDLQDAIYEEVDIIYKEKLKNGEITEDHFAEKTEDGEFEVFGPDAQTDLRFEDQQDANEAANQLNQMAMLDAKYEIKESFSDEKLRIIESNMIDANQEVSGGPTKYGSYTLEGGTNYREVLLTLPIEATPETYNSSHFDQSNILTHIRLADHVDVNGNKTLMVEEIQSDWHQEGRKKGYKKPEDEAKMELLNNKNNEIIESKFESEEFQANKKKQKDVEETVQRLSKEKNELDSEFEEGISTPKSGLTEERAIELESRIKELQGTIRAFRGELSRYQRQEDNLRDQYKKEAGEESGLTEATKNKRSLSQQVPDAPLKQTEAWSMLAFKRVLDMAVAQGYDSVSWAGGEVHADRYDLSKQVESISYRKFGEKYALYIIDTHGREMPAKSEGYSIEELEENVGKDITQKILNNEGTDTAREKMKVDFLKSLPENTRGIAEEMIEAEESDLMGDVYTEGWDILQNEAPDIDANIIHDIRDHDSSSSKKLTGIDLKVGGEGMIGFYDKMLPKAVGKYIKKLDKKAKVGISSVEKTKETLEINDKIPSELVTVEVVKRAKEIIQRDLDTPATQSTFVDSIDRQIKNLEKGGSIDETWLLKGLNGTNKILEAMGELGIEIPAITKSQDVWNVPITEKLKEEIGKGQVLFQDQKDPKGTFNKKTMRINLLAKADPSTFLHETGHLFLEEIMEDFAYVNSLTGDLDSFQSQFKEDGKAILEYLEVNSFNEIEREHHEKWARSFEKYLMEGKAPSARLRKAFARFSVWLTSVYRSLMNIDAPLTSEVRGVMDRLLATEDEIAAALEEQGYKEKFDPNLVKKIDPKKYKRYEELRELYTQEAKEKMSLELMKSLKRERELFLTDEFKKIKKEVGEAVDLEPVYITIDMFKDGKTTNGDSLKINKAELISRYGEAYVKTIPSYVYQSKGGLLIDVATEISGYEDGKTMLDEIIAAPTKTAKVKEVSENLMKIKYEDVLVDPTEYEDIAKKFIHSDKRTELLQMELAILSDLDKGILKEGTKKTLRRVPTNEEMQKEASKVLGSVQLKSLRPHLYQQAEVKNARLVEEFVQKEEYDKAFEAKAKELLNHQLYRKAIELREYKQKNMKRFKMLDKSDEKLAKTRDMAFINAARSILARYGLAKSEQANANMDRIKDYDQDVFEMVTGIIESVQIPEKDTKNLTNDEFQEITDTFNALWDLSRSSRQIELDGVKIEIEDYIAKMDVQSEKFKSKKVKEHYDRSKTKWEKVYDGFLSLKAKGRRLEHWVEVMNSGDISGLYNIFFTPVSEATDTYNEVKTKYNEKIVALSKEINIPEDAIVSDELKFKFKDKSEILGALIHIGNESNLKKLLVGRGWGEISEDGTLNTARWDKFLTRMYDQKIITKVDMDFIQSMWDMMEEIKPMAQKTHKQVFGHYFNEITSNPFQTPWGEYKGGYAPASVDRDLVESAAKRDVVQDLLKESVGYGLAGSGGNGFAKNRIDNYNRPLNINMNMITKHIDDVLRFAIVKPSVINAAKIASNPKFTELMKDIDPKVVNDMVIPALNRADKNLKSDIDPNSPVLGKRVMSYFQRSMVNNIMFMNVVNTVEQATGLIIATTKIKPLSMLSGMNRYLGNRVELAKMISEKSTYMRTKTDNTMYEFAAKAAQMFEAKTKFDTMKEFANKNAFILQSGFQNFTDNMVWIAQYDEAIANGKKDIEAVRMADAIIRTTQNAARPLDIAAFQSNAMLGMVQMFMGYFNMVANVNATNFTKLYHEDIGMKEKYQKALYLYVAGYAAPAILSAALRKAAAGGLDEEEDGSIADDLYDVLIVSQREYGLAMLPLVGPAINAGLNRNDDKFYNDKVSASPVFEGISAVTGVVSSIIPNIEGEFKQQKPRDYLTALGIVSGLPVLPLYKPAKYLQAVESGEAQPKGPVDYVRGLTTGKKGVR